MLGAQKAVQNCSTMLLCYTVRRSSSAGTNRVSSLWNASSVSPAGYLVSWGRCSAKQLIVENYIEQRAVDLQTAVVVDESQFPEPVHEEANPRAGGPNHLGQGLLTYFGNHALGHAFLAEMGEQ